MSTFRFYCVICGTPLQASVDSQHDLVECHSCRRYVPVPRPANLRGKFANCQSVLPPQVLELTVTFECTECESRLRTDARWEGRRIGCPDCGGMTAVPRWSTVPSWPVAQRSGDTAPATRAAADLKSAVLSIEEMEFLRGPAATNPEAA